MPKSSKIYICQKCGERYMRWQGKCEQCGSWNSLQESEAPVIKSGRQGASGQVLKPQKFSEIKGKEIARYKTGIFEFDRAVGGGIVPGSVILLAGNPGIGKSTLVLQIVEALSEKSSIIPASRDPRQSRDNHQSSILYISGEESASQIKLRADRLGIKTKNLDFLAETNIDNIISTILQTKPKLIIVDSIQTMAISFFPSSAGSVVQVRESAQRLAEAAKSEDISIILIGHVTKEGTVAGPKTLEHLVDTVLYLEGDRYHSFRILRSFKNRFGSTGEAGVFEMKEGGLCEVKNPSQLFLEERQRGVSGSAIVATVEGTRAFLVEVQALTARTNFGYPRRTSSGFDFNRLQLLIATLSRRCGLPLESADVYLNVAGGFKLDEPAVDLGICLAISSAILGKIVDLDLVAIGEVGLSGEIRSVSNLEKRIIEASKLGFKRVIAPRMREEMKIGKCQLIQVATLREAVRKALTK
ncbi:MAG: DNA repair protein RadA [Patescibacteria group bacterium]